MSQTRGWLAAALALAALFGFFVFESLRLSLTDTLGPGPGFFPFWLGVLGAALAIVLILQLRQPPEGATEAITFDRAGTRNVLLVLAGLIAASALLEVAGFGLAVDGLVVSLIVVLGGGGWLAIRRFGAARQ